MGVWVGHLASSSQALAQALAYCKLLGTHQHVTLGSCPRHSHTYPSIVPSPKAVCKESPALEDTGCNSDCDTAYLCLLPLPSFWVRSAHFLFAFWPLTFPIEINTFGNNYIRRPANFLLPRKQGRLYGIAGGKQKQAIWSVQRSPTCTAQP